MQNVGLVPREISLFPGDIARVGIINLESVFMHADSELRVGHNAIQES